LRKSVAAATSLQTRRHAFEVVPIINDGGCSALVQFPLRRFASLFAFFAVKPEAETAKPAKKTAKLRKGGHPIE
jgi:hypothetical protein